MVKPFKRQNSWSKKQNTGFNRQDGYAILNRDTDWRNSSAMRDKSRTC